MPPVNGVCGATGGGASGLPAPPPHGVWGDCRNSPGVYGSSLNDNGVRAASRNKAGIFGASETRWGLLGDGPAGGVFGHGQRFGIYGIADGFPVSELDELRYPGVYGQGWYGAVFEGRHTGMSCTGGAGDAANFTGNVTILGTLYVDGQIKSTQLPKSSVVSHPDGTQRVLCAVESPECWFEDFGRAEVNEGHAVVELDPDFAALIDTDDYHVFVTPEGDSNGLYVSMRSPREFEVREQGGATNTVGFSYRLVAKPKAVRSERLQIFEPPAELAPVEFEREEFETAAELKDWQQRSE